MAGMVWEEMAIQTWWEILECYQNKCEECYEVYCVELCLGDEKGNLSHRK